MSSAAVSLRTAVVTAVVTFLGLYLGVPLVGFAPGRVAFLVIAIAAALVAGLLVFAGGNFLERMAFAFVLALNTGFLWFLRSSLGYVFVCATFASICAIVGTAVEERLARRLEERADPGSATRT